MSNINNFEEFRNWQEREYQRQIWESEQEMVEEEREKEEERNREREEELKKTIKMTERNIEKLRKIFKEL